ncbi:MAG: carotenoid 1,2-hydratase, partial [Verrucomicrobiaceae bacterium]|nr:carotenoid 1,2-hydratase [Verrucomicrobiaceae bacterium]
MKQLLLFCVIAASATAGDWRVAEPGWSYEFPRDHHPHPGFKTEWWYFTGNLTDDSGRRFGYQLTFFRQGIQPPEDRDPALSRFVVGDLKFAHFTLTDAAGKRFQFQQKTSRGAFGEAGFDDGERLAWIETWTLKMEADGRFVLHADGA